MILWTNEAFFESVVEATKEGKQIKGTRAVAKFDESYDQSSCMSTPGEGSNQDEVETKNPYEFEQKLIFTN